MSLGKVYAFMSLPEQDQARMEFLKRLDDAYDVQVTDWEADFIEDFLRSPRSMTPAQRAVVDRMREHYEERL